MSSPILFILVFVVTIGLTQGYISGWFSQLSNKLAEQPPMQLVGQAGGIDPGERIDFSICHIGGGKNCVVDGDTIWVHGQKIRIADIDTPETHDFKCSSEKELGDRATVRLHEILESGAITLAPIDRDRDQYGRLLRIVQVDGSSVGDTLVNEGLARWYGNGRQSWC